MYYPDNYMIQMVKTLENCFPFFCSDLTVFIFPTLLADFKDPILNRDRGPALLAELHINHAPTILILFLYKILFKITLILGRKDVRNPGMTETKLDYPGRIFFKARQPRASRM